MDLTEDEAKQIAHAIAIAFGHAYEKHALNVSESGDSISASSFESLILVTHLNPTKDRELIAGRHVFWNAEEGFLVLLSPRDPDLGTAYWPKEGMMDTRSSTNPIQPLPLVPGMNGKSEGLVLHGTHALLMHRALGALFNVVRGLSSETHIGVSESALKRIFDEFDRWVKQCEYDSRGVIIVRDERGDAIGSFQHDFSGEEVRALRNTLEIVMLDLGQSEFSTITGFSLIEAKQLLDRLNATVLNPLHLEQQAEPVAH